MADEVQVQSAVWHVELGRGKRVVLWVLVGLVAVALALVYAALQFRGLEQREAMDMAQLARNLARGEGYTTSLIRPLSLWQLREFAPDHKQRLMDHPDLINPPVYPAVLAGVFKCFNQDLFVMGAGDRVFKPERWVIVPLGQLFLFAGLLLVYWWGKQLFDQRVALTTALLLLFSDTWWSQSISGLPTTLLLGLWLGSFGLLFRADQWINPAEDAGPARWGRGLAAMAGSAVVLGLCHLTQYRTIFFVAPLALYVWRIAGGRRDWLLAAAFVGLFAATVAPWWIRNYQICGNPWGIAFHNLNVPGDILARSYHPEADAFFSVRGLFRNLLLGLRNHLFTSLPTAAGDFLVFFFLVGLLYGFRRRGVARVRGVVVGCLAAAVIGMSVIPLPAGWNLRPAHEADLLLLVMPVTALFGVAFFYLLVDRIQFEMPLLRTAVIALFVAANVAGLAFSLLPPRRGMFPWPPYLAPYTAHVARWFAPDELGCSDLPWALAWVGDRRTVWLPATEKDFIEINDFAAADKRFSFLFITPHMLDRRYQSELLKGEFKDWAGVLRGKLSGDFPLKAATLFWPNGEQILFADRPRWAEEKFDPATPPPDKKKKTPAETP